MDIRLSRLNIRNAALLLALLVFASGCEKVLVLAGTIEGDGVTPLSGHDAQSWSPRIWIVEDDWHRVFMSVRVNEDRLLFFARTRSDPSATPPGVWWTAGAYPMTLEVETDCDSSVQYFDNPGNSFGNNFLRPDLPDIYPHSPETEAPGLAAILKIENCAYSDIELTIVVLDPSGEPAREHRLTIEVEQVDWYYNPLIP